MTTYEMSADNKSVTVGQTLDGFKLIHIDGRSALFEKGPIQVRLFLPGSDKDSQ